MGTVPVALGLCRGARVRGPDESEQKDLLGPPALITGPDRSGRGRGHPHFARLPGSGRMSRPLPTPSCPRQWP